MKNSTNWLKIGALLACATVFSCESPKIESESPQGVISKKNLTVEHDNAFFKDVMKSGFEQNILAIGCEEYSLVLSGSTGTPHASGLLSYLANVDMVSGTTTGASPIMLSSGANIRTVTGITRVPGTPPLLYGVTGMNSSHPRRLIRIDPATGISTIAGITRIGNTPTAFQDIEYCASNSRFYAIKEGTNQIYRSNNGLLWQYLATAPSGNAPLNGLTVVAASGMVRIWVIAGQRNVVCSGNYGDMYEYNLAGVLQSTSSYNASSSSGINWVNKELGLHYVSGSTACTVRNFVVGSALNILSHNLTLCPTAPVFISQIKPTYDFAFK